MEDKDWVPAEDALPPPSSAHLAPLHVVGQAEVRFGQFIGQNCPPSELSS